jgi:hypothetical protein
MRSIRPLAAFALLAAAATPGLAQNQAVQLTTGVDAHFDVPYDPAFVAPSGLTVEAWVTYDDSTIPTGLFYWPTIARQNVAPGQESWLFRVGASNTNNLSLEFAVRQQNGQVPRIAYRFTPGQFAVWTHLAATFDGATLTILVNGAPVQTQTFPNSPIADNGGALRVGNGDVSAPGHETWNGQIDELRIWPFARSAAEISATINDEIIGLPGEALTFNLNGNYVDSSRGRVGTPVGPIQFTASALNLNQRITAALNIGPASNTCSRAMASAFGSLPLVGNPSFALVGTGGPASAAGTALIAAGLAGSPLAILGVQFHLQPALVGVTVPTDALGNARLPLGVPNQPALAGVGLAAQWLFLDPACGSQGLTASEGLGFTILQ